MNPQIAGHIQHLQICWGSALNSKMRLPFDFNVGVNHSYQEPENTLLFLWDYELLGRALHQMVNLKAFEWLYDEIPIFDVRLDVIKPFSNQCILERVDGRDGLFVSLFDTPIEGAQAVVRDLMSLCRWPKLQVLRLHIVDDPGGPPTEDLRIVAIAAKQVSQLTELVVLFPNVECIDLRGSGVYQHLVRWEGEAPNMVNKVLASLSGFMNLRVILGFRFWDYSETEEMRETPRRREYFHWVHTLLPRLDFCGVNAEDGIEFIHEGNNVSWKWVSLPAKTFAGRERDFTIREEFDRFAS
ncbi:hypothetical protein Clacol_004987 [Clathrus columnatus]|uniref:Uncharacterized protein n=1 Tax=Clathrus columnatus TaxID=1419009 RepID=A0AAV5AC22_9AGAM|nr:hypothetical protein Clacol_004987 [Clathrus columnatus]